MIKFNKILLLLIVGIISITKSFADHITTAELSYTCLSNNRFEFTLVVYNECDETNLQR